MAASSVWTTSIAANWRKRPRAGGLSVNFNSPGQVVIAGHKEAVERANVLMKESGCPARSAAAGLRASHCALMKPAAEKAGCRPGWIEIEVPAIACP